MLIGLESQLEPCHAMSGTIEMIEFCEEDRPELVRMASR